MYRKIEDFIADWAYESEATIKVFKNLTDKSLNQKATNDGRSLGFIAWHLTLTIGEMLSKAGLKVTAPPEDAPMPNNAAEIIKSYENAAPSVSEQIKTDWKDEMLFNEVEMYGEKWQIRNVLYSLVKHQAHHRGQMTVLMRQAGLKVPGVYGPSKEEWAQFGMQPMP
jgi:uncharacterized damage-inducible protein DinB